MTSSSPIVVAGMHRSGTSATMRLLTHLGVDIGPSHTLIGATDHNPFGHFEQFPIMDLNDELLDSVKSHWAVPVDRSDVLVDAAHDKLGIQGRELIDELFGATTRRWAVKDPRFCLTLPYWREVLPHSPTVVVPVRNPLDVAASLAERNKVPVDYGLELWRAYHELLLRDAAGLRLTVFRFDDLIENPQGIAESLSRDLDLEVDERDATASVGAIDAKARHHRSELADMPSGVAALWDELQAGNTPTFESSHSVEFVQAPIVVALDGIARDDRARLRYRLDQSEYDLKSIKSSPVARLMQPLWTARQKRREAASDDVG